MITYVFFTPFLQYRQLRPFRSAALALTRLPRLSVDLYRQVDLVLTYSAPTDAASR